MPRLPYALLPVILARCVFDAVRLLGDGPRYDNGEERYNATVGWYVAHGGLGDQLFAMQYKTFCGGCSVHAMEAAVSLGLFGDQLWAWKGWAILWTAAIHALGFLALDRQVNRAAAWAWAVLFLVPPPGVQDLGLMLWGNHAEGGLFVVGALALPAGFWQGVVLGLGLWFTRTTAHAWILLLPALWQRQWRVLPGLLVGLAPLLVPAAKGDVGTYDLSLRANLLPDGVSWAVERAQWLLTGPRLAPRLLPTVTSGTNWAWAWLAAVGASALILRRHVLVGLAAAFVVLWSVSGFPVPKALPHSALLQSRYFAPWLLAGLLLVAGAAGRLRPLPRAALLALALAAPLFAHTKIVPTLRPDPALLTQAVIQHTWFAGIVYRRLDLARVQAAHSDDPATESALRRLEGYVAADITLTDPTVRDRLQGEAVSAWWQARTEPRAAWGGLNRLNEAVAADPDPLAAGRGAAANLAWDAPKGVDLVPRLRSGLPDGAPCRLCAAAGMRLQWDCPDTACVAAGVSGPDASEVAFGVGLACTHDCDAVAAALGPHAAAFTAGTHSALARMDQPFFPERAPKAGRPGIMPKR